MSCTGQQVGTRSSPSDKRALPSYPDLKPESYYLNQGEKKHNSGLLSLSST